MTARNRRMLPALVAALAAVATVATACSDDGREMRDPVFPAPETTTTTIAPPGGGTG